MNVKVGILLILALVACKGKEVELVQVIASATEPSNQTSDTANEIRPDNGGVLGHLKAGESDFYYVDIDFFDSGNHTISLSNLSADLDLMVIDWEGNEQLSSASSTTDETILISTDSLPFFSDGAPDHYRIIMRVTGKTTVDESDFRLTLSTP